MKILGSQLGMRILTAFTLAAAITGLASPALAQERPGPLILTVHPLRGGVYWVEGGRSNTAFIVGDKGVVAFDAQMTAAAARQELAEIAKITPKPVDTILISHADPDHIGGLPGFKAGIPIIATENARSEMVVSAHDPHIPPVYVGLYQTLLNYLPTRTIGASESVVLDGVPMELMYIAPAHTSGDMPVYLPKQKIVLAGDIITTNIGKYPVNHLGGSSLGWITAMKALLALDADTYVPGHGPIESKAMLRVRLHDAELRRAQIKTMVDDHKTLAEIEQAYPEPGASPMFKDFTETVYDELTEGYPPAAPPWNNIVHRQ
jgi:glyoxylase-like metal-dependent hydrolase (beta-lactamase superfamily II)